MKFWTDIVNSGSLGTAKAALRWNQLPPELQDQLEPPVINDIEEEFLTLASLSYQYRVGGFIPSMVKEEALSSAEPEVIPYASAAATQLFKLIMSEDLPTLTELWIERCRNKNRVVEPELLPELLDLGIRRKEFRSNVKAIMGKRGEWLATLNPDWQLYLGSQDAESLWQMGTLDQRKEFLKEVRHTNPSEAIVLLKSTWETEGANDKASFLDLLRINLGPSDLEWLESLKEKSQKVTTVILDLIKSVEGSTLVEKYWLALKDHIRIKSGKALLGMITKTSIEIDEDISVSDELFKTGIEKLSSDKNISDNQHIVAQLIAAIPPAYWRKHFAAEPAAIIELFQKEKNTALYLPPLAHAAIRFKESEWLEELLSVAKTDLIANQIPLLLKSLPPARQQTFAIRFMEDKPQEIVALMMEQNEEWSVPLAKAILKFTSREIYAYNRAFYRLAVAFLPIALMNELNSFALVDEQLRTYWTNQSDEIKRLLELKKQILQSF